MRVKRGKRVSEMLLVEKYGSEEKEWGRRKSLKPQRDEERSITPPTILIHSLYSAFSAEDIIINNGGLGLEITKQLRYVLTT